MADEVQKPLTRDERRDLKALIKGDYENLRLQFNQEINEAATHEAEEIKLKYAGRDQECVEASRTIREMEERFRREYEDQIEQFREDGLVIKADNYRSRFSVEAPKTFRVQGLEEELEKSQKKWNVIASRGRSSLSTQENDTQRELIMTGLQNSGAQELLQSLPSAADIIKTATASIGNSTSKQIEIGE